MKAWYFYNEVDGIFSGFKYSGPERYLAANTPAGHKAVFGTIYPSAQRFDLASGAVVESIPPSPGPDYEWSQQDMQWVISENSITQRFTRAGLESRIALLERKQQRAMREAIIYNSAESKALLAEIDGQISEIRQQLITS